MPTGHAIIDLRATITITTVIIIIDPRSTGLPALGGNPDQWCRAVWCALCL